MAGNSIDIARRLRSNQTEAEKKLWRFLRAKRLAGYKFRRQFPIGSYVVDFCCFDKGLIVELDGGQHELEREKDNVRTSYLGSRGYKVIRFWNNDVLKNTAGVLEEILRNLGAPPPSL